MGILYFGPAAENAFMAFEQKTIRAVEIAGNCLYLQFQRAHTGSCGCGCRFMPGFASPALLGTKQVEQIGPQICAHLWLQRGKDCREIRQQWKVFSPERSAEEPLALPARPGCPGGRLICSQKLQVRRKSIPRARLSHLGTPTPHFSFSPMPPF